jgi:hypothetical protein
VNPTVLGITSSTYLIFILLLIILLLIQTLFVHIIDGHVEVRVDTCVKGEAALPVPVPEEFVEVVNDALGWILRWPKDLVISCTGSVRMFYI